MAMKRTTMKNILLAGLMGIWASAALAHSPIESTSPISESTIKDVPSEILLEFKGEIRLTRVTMSHGPHSNVALNVSGKREFTSIHRILMQGMGSGNYVIDWRGLGIDGHAMNGTFSFAVE